MIFDMNPDLVQRSFLEPCLLKYTSFDLNAFNIPRFIKSLDVDIQIDAPTRSYVLVSVRGSSEAHALRQAAYALKMFQREKVGNTETVGDGYYVVRGNKVKNFDRLLKENNITKHYATAISITSDGAYTRKYQEKTGEFFLHRAPDAIYSGAVAWLAAVGLQDMLLQEHERLIKLQQELAERRRQKDKSLGEIFGFDDASF